MGAVYSSLVALPPLVLLATGLLSLKIAHRKRAVIREIAGWLMAGVFGSAVGAGVCMWAQGPLDVVFLSWAWPLPMNLGVYFDSLSAIMVALVSFIGWVIVRYSGRYLDGEVTQGRFFCWILATVGAVLGMVVARNLLMFTAAWMFTSVGLHQLLTHYSDRPWAIWAARKKFLISRLGDIALMAALVLTYYSFGSFDYRDIFAAVPSVGQGDVGISWALSAIAMLFVIGAMTKSAQVPFHSWLPDTMETPTPVSALMHAGVINAGGFLVIRLSPLVSQSLAAMDFLTLVGAFTAITASVVMLTQTSVKRSLAYSTIAQMGFMMLQCGQGAFSAALLHIVAHSLYKAHAFLSCGSVLDSAAAAKPASLRPAGTGWYWGALPAALATAIGISGVSVWWWRIDLAAKPGAAILGLILVMALTHLVWQSLTIGSWGVALRGVVAASVVTWLYLGGWVAMDSLLAKSVSHHPVLPSPREWIITSLVAIGFLSTFVLQALTLKATPMAWLTSLYVHASHGFYLDIPARRVTAMLWGERAATP